jgi:AP-1-like transcription factor
MAGARTNNFGNPQTQLSPTQQDLLLAALASNNPANNRKSTSDSKTSPPDFDMAQPNGFDQFGTNDVSLNPDYFASPHSLGQVNQLNFEQSPFDDLLDGDGLDFDTTEGDLMIGGLPGDNGTLAESDLHDKRKSPDSPSDEQEGSSSKKGGSGEVKEAKKPGRKPLTSEPTTVSA